MREAEAALQKQQAALAFRKAQLRDQQRKERDHKERRRRRETNTRFARLRGAFLGVWDRLTGQHRRTRVRNEIEAKLAHLRDKEEKHKLIQRQLADVR